MKFSVTFTQDGEVLLAVENQTGLDFNTASVLLNIVREIIQASPTSDVEQHNHPPHDVYYVHKGANHV